MGRKDNQSYYDEFAAWYERERHDGYHRLIDDLEVDLVSRYGRGKDVLEVGCGTGLILERVAKVARKAVGIDLSPGMLEQARARGLEVSEGCATELPFEDATFDVVYSFKVLAHVQDIRKAVAEAARVVRPGGVLLLEFYNPRSIRYLAKTLGGPQKISDATRESAVYTRWDDPETVTSYLPEGVDLMEWAGVRVFTPAAFVHKLPVVGSALRKLEFVARDSPLSRYGGFLVAVARRQEQAADDISFRNAEAIG
ncbi:methyltransferase domain-containing protein [Lujinxingia vulgaris]|uniref:Methyltransferase domain-containing protein n=1 Tax=Lujinxingia vulgaris TaxID=2600176 RepID=A0A5C6XGY6_9DELT|nr:methyltransferase domain-containing protein [Lujinxingia vulgaris]TXD38165.1 methyltransferase domain-containing protein [Lujinxingia vulgaris]